MQFNHLVYWQFYILNFIVKSSKKGFAMKIKQIPKGAHTTFEKVISNHYFRFHTPHMHLGSVFGEDWFGKRAESFARFFGTPTFLIAQTVIVAIWIAVNSLGFTKFDVYPFILLNLAFSLQAAYAAPLILLAQTRQADRDKVLADADAQHREDLASASEQRQALATEQMAQLQTLLEENTLLTETVRGLSERIEALTSELHGKFYPEEKAH